MSDYKKEYINWHLWWGGAWEKNHQKTQQQDNQPSVPLFPSYYSYLLKLAPGVGLVDIYPWLAELMFFSIAVDGDDILNDKINMAPINMVSIFVDDNRDNVAYSRLNSELRKELEPINELFKLKHLLSCFTNNKPRLFIVDTFGQFKDIQQDSNVLTQKNGNVYATSRLVGAGNPMQMMRRFTVIGELPLKKESRQNVFAGNDLGNLNCFVINSISNLYRSMGVRDAMLLVRAMMEQGVWKSTGEKEKTDTKKERLIDNKGILFAILHEQVFPEADTMYIETFFDGVIGFKKTPDSSQRKVSFCFERFPPPLPGQDAQDRQFQPDYSAFWTYGVNEDGQLIIDEVPKNESKSS
ncbi:MAG: hypothetical protein HQL77_15405 [Magnetococcales bacterium]|nr:hypothetical protein [Magnetococcales bacterium]